MAPQPTTGTAGATGTTRAATAGSSTTASSTTVPSTVQRVGAALVGLGASSYVGVKVLWLSGSLLGVRSLGAVTSAQWRWDNALTGAFGLAALVVAAALWSRRGLRVPGFLVLPALWSATGLLAPFVVFLPAAGLLALAGHPIVTPSSDSADPRLAGWVFLVVYGGFLTVAIGLALAVPAYVRRRWGHLVAGRLADRPPRRFGIRALGATAAAGSVALPHVGWVLGLSAGRTDPPTAMDRVGDITSATLALLTMASVVAWTRQRPLRLPVVLPAAGLWVGSAWMVSSALSVPQLLTDPRWAPGGLTYAAYALVTVLTLVAGVVVTVAVLGGGRRSSAAYGKRHRRE
jgi:hypothetical protein